MSRREIVVVGASAGGIEPLREMIRGLPDDLHAAVFITLHVSAGENALPHVLERRGGLPVTHATDGEPIVAGRVYVAAPDHHMTLVAGRVRSIRGPRVNGHRPAIDPLFRSAAIAHRESVIGVILSGALDDGAAGLRSVKESGGVAIVQDPSNAAYDGMPTAALALVKPDAVVPSAAIAPAILSFLGREVEDPVEVEPSRSAADARFVAMAELGNARGQGGDDPGAPSDLACPACGGVLWDGGRDGFACRVGHAYTAQTLVGAQAEGVETALWSALRASQESAALCTRLRDQAIKRGHAHTSAHFAERVRDAEHRGAVLRDLLRVQVDPSIALPEPSEAREK